MSQNIYDEEVNATGGKVFVSIKDREATRVSLDAVYDEDPYCGEPVELDMTQLNALITKLVNARVMLWRNLSQ